MLAGQVIGQLSNLSAASLIRGGQLVPMLLQHATEHIGVHLYYGSRKSQPRRVRSFIDLALQRLSDPPAYVLTPRELAGAAKRARVARRRG